VGLDEKISSTIETAVLKFVKADRSCGTNALDAVEGPQQSSAFKAVVLAAVKAQLILFLYGAVRNGFEECNIITRGIGRGGP
jgi:hypothetical protein